MILFIKFSLTLRLFTSRRIILYKSYYITIVNIFKLNNIILDTTIIIIVCITHLSRRIGGTDRSIAVRSPLPESRACARLARLNFETVPLFLSQLTESTH